ncbi:glycosyltransferase family 4 protein [Patescibacteria group bacterium]|nr:glycosyltransferase family 4 protein [Patescibacteria group bacterium]
MRIAIDLRMAGGDYGIGRYGLELTGRILDLDRENTYMLLVRNPDEFRQYAGRKNVTVIRADYPHYSMREQVAFYWLLRRLKPDLVHFINFNVPIFYNRPFVVTVHDLIHHRMPGNKKSRILHRAAYKAIIRHAIMASKRIITVSNFSRDEILRYYQVQKNKISVVYEAATVQPVSDSDIAQVRQKFGIGKPYIIFVGVMERKKNVLALAAAFDILKDDYSQNIQLVLAGREDRHYPEIIRQVSEIRYKKDLILTGVVGDKDKYALYKGADAFVSASLFEGFGLPGVEAMSVGTPLAVSNIEVFNEIYDNGAIYFDPKNPRDIAQKINLLMSDRKYRELISNNAFQRAKDFSWEKAARETLSIYKQP